MNYGFGADNAKSTTRPFPVKEIVDNVELEKAEYIKAISAGGNEYEGIRFQFKRTSNGQTSNLSDLKSPPRENWSNERILPDGTKISKEEDFNNKMKEYVSYLRHIAFAFGVTEEDLTAKGNFKTFGEAASNYCDVLNARKTNRKVYLKTVKNKDGYTSLPSYIGNGFCVSMDNGIPEFKYTDRELQLIELASRSGVAEDTTTGAVESVESKKLSSSDIDDLI